MIERTKQLWHVCRSYIEDLEITCPEAIYQKDGITQTSLEFVEQICEIVGYHEQVNDETSSVADQSRDQTSEPNLTEEDLAECRRRFEEYNKEALQILRGSGR
jgi:hypothetical protein